MDSDMLLRVVAAAVVGFLAGWLIKTVFAGVRLRKADRVWQQQLDACKDARDSAGRKVRQLRSKCSEMEEAFEKVESEFDLIRKTMKQRERSINNLRVELYDAKAKIQEDDQLRARVAEQDKKLAELNKIRSEMFRRALHLSEMDSMKSELETLSQRATQLEGDNASLVEDNAQLQQTLRESSKLIENLQSDLTELRSAEPVHEAVSGAEGGSLIAELERRIEERSQAVAELRGELDQAREHLSRYQQQIHKMEMAREAAAPAQGRPEVSEEARAPQGGDVDDLQQISGIGPAIERTLNGLGIFQYRQLVNLSPAQMDTITAKVKGFQDRMRRHNWIDQARSLMEQRKP